MIKLFKVSEGGCLHSICTMSQREAVCKALIPWADLTGSGRARAYFLHSQPSAAFSWKNSAQNAIFHHHF